MIRYVAFALSEPDLKRQPLPLHFTTHGWEIDLPGLCDALNTRAPSRWSSHIYGSESFTKKTLTAAGWLPVSKDPEEVARSGPPMIAA